MLLYVRTVECETWLLLGEVSDRQADRIKIGYEKSGLAAMLLRIDEAIAQNMPLPSTPKS